MSFATYTTFSAGSRASNGFNLFITNPNPRDAYATYENLSNVLRPSHSQNTSPKSHSGTKVFGLKKYWAGN